MTQTKQNATQNGLLLIIREFVDSYAGIIFGVQPDCSVQKRMVHISNIWYVIFVTNLQNLYLSLVILRNVLLTYFCGNINNF